jgi:hypothetical protein
MQYNMVIAIIRRAVWRKLTTLNMVV